jgi:hypothetical protein
MSVRWLGTCLVGAFLLGCGSAPEIRVVNETGTDVTAIVVDGPSQREVFGPLGVGQATDYRPFSRAYRYSAGSYVANGVEHKIEIFDYVGEEELGSGQYEYVLTRGSLGLR